MIYGVTGHRPDKLPGGYTVEAHEKLVRFAHGQFMGKFLGEKDNTLVTGMAQGWDQACALACNQLSVPFIAAIPCNNYDALWPRQARDEYRELLKLAKDVRIISPGLYDIKKLQLRNQWIVDLVRVNGGKMIALWDGSRGGTWNCVKYAEHRKVEVINVWSDWEKF